MHAYMLANGVVELRPRPARLSPAVCTYAIARYSYSGAITAMVVDISGARRCHARKRVGRVFDCILN